MCQRAPYLKFIPTRTWAATWPTTSPSATSWTQEFSSSPPTRPCPGSTPETLPGTIPQLDPDGPHTIALQIRVLETLSRVTLLQNRFTISCNELGPKSSSICTQVFNGMKLAVNKTTLQKAVHQGEEVSYIIEFLRADALSRRWKEKDASTLGPRWWPATLRNCSSLSLPPRTTEAIRGAGWRPKRVRAWDRMHSIRRRVFR
ncbi:MAG: hypothetical protein NTU95_07605 [Methanothrix sp.]|nr:hypothetical protein [Methanothrix sp.]